MFNLIVNGGGWADGRDEFLLNRIFEYTADDLVARFRTDQGPNFNELMRLPTLFVREGVADEVAQLGTITAARPSGRNNIVLNYTYDPGVPGIQNRTLVGLRRDLGIAEDWEFGRTHWAVKDVDVCRVLLQHGLRRRLGPRVFQIAEHENVEADLVSVMMPFSAEFRPVYETLHGLCSELHRRCVRADDIWENDVVMQDVVSLIDRSRVVIADCTGRNPNVFYEIGIAHSLGRDVILVSQAAADVPFDLRHLRFVQYLNNAEGRAALADGLRARVEAMV